MSGSGLAGRRILVTRPREQAGGLARGIEAAGGVAVLFPVLEILDVADAAPLLALIDRLETFDLAIFISPTAAARAMNLVLARRRFPPGLRVAAVGRGSARELARFGIPGVIAPAGRFDSEALLELPELAQVAGRRVVIFRGEGGRELLGDTLAARGASVEYAECYRRGRPATDPSELLHAWARGGVDAVTVTSGEGLRNLYDMVGALGRHWLRGTPLFAPHPRIVAAARELGVENAVETGPGDEGLLAGLLAWFGSPAGRGAVSPDSKPQRAA